MEKFISGYCRVLDKSRMVEVEDEDGEVFIDCAYRNCPHAAVCQIGQQITCFCRRKKNEDHPSSS